MSPLDPAYGKASDEVPHEPRDAAAPPEELPCPLCASAAGRRMHTEAWISIRRCAACGFLYSEERDGDFRRDELSAEIDAFYRWLEATRDERVPLLERRITEVARRFALPARALSVLEVGTGGGALAHACSRLGHYYLGLEPLLDERFTLDDVRRLPEVEVLPQRLEVFASERRFDLAVMDNVLEHVARPVEAVRALLGFLEPHGVLWIQVPNEASLMAKHRVFSLFKERRITFPGHVNLFTRRSLGRCLAAAGAAEVVLGGTSASDPVLTRLLLMRPPGAVLRAVMAALRWTALDVRLGRAYWLDAYARPPAAPAR